MVVRGCVFCVCTSRCDLTAVCDINLVLLVDTCSVKMRENIPTPSNWANSWAYLHRELCYPLTYINTFSLSSGIHRFDVAAVRR